MYAVLGKRAGYWAASGFPALINASALAARASLSDGRFPHFMGKGF
jgi:hypothetical protein